MIVRLATLLMASTAFGQDHPGQLLAGATIVEIASIDPANTEFDDLEPLKEIIGDARVVTLGEQTHGDGAVFLCKSRLVRFLHEEMGFDVLCWESGILNCELLNERIADPEVPIEDAFADGFDVWSQSLQLRPTLDYVRSTFKTERPMTQTGYDVHIAADATARLASRLRTLVEAAGAKPPADAGRAVELLPSVFASPWPQNAEGFRNLTPRLQALIAWLEEHRDTLVGAVGADEVDHTLRMASDAAWWCDLMGLLRGGGRPDMSLAIERDRRMGDNLVYLANERFAGRKIVVWSATTHLVHRPKEIELADSPGQFDEAVSAGEIASKALGDDLYTIGFTALRGAYGVSMNPQALAIDDPPEGSIEWALDAVAHPFLYLDFRSLPQTHTLRDRHWMRPMGYAWTRAIWPDQMDAVICIDEMFKSSGRVFAPDGYELTVGD